MLQESVPGEVDAQELDFDFVDLMEVLFTVPKSRFVVSRGDERELRLHLVRYEVSLDDSLVATARLYHGGAAVNLDEFSAVGGHLQFHGGALSLWRTQAEFSADPGCFWEVTVVAGSPVTSQSFPATEGSDSAGEVVAPMGERVAALSGVRLISTIDGISDDEDQPLPFGPDFTAEADRVVAQWMSKVPECGAARHAMMRQCWWTLGGNTLELKLGGRVCHPVVPSKRGYVGLWQWDAYFIAVGLAHGDIELALEQLEIALRFQLPDGQLPDVVHEDGVLASSRDLPPSDRAKLEADGSVVAGRDDVPLTKPPLTAWALEAVLGSVEVRQREEYLRYFAPKVAASQAWWFSPDSGASTGVVARAGMDARFGVPRYAHPYSSGLDDSPVFDYELPATTPDLLAYLWFQELRLRDWAERGWCELPGGQNASDQRIEVVREALGELWDGELGFFRAYGGDEGAPIPHRTVVSLLAAWAGQLSAAQLEGICRDVEDPKRFAKRWGLPSVAMDDSGFRAETMWRGPIWVNTTYLVAEGLERCGQADLAARLRQQILDYVQRCGPVEYVSPMTGKRCDTATTSFGWSAALYVDLAARGERQNTRSESWAVSRILNSR